jgi:hypothetical protein
MIEKLSFKIRGVSPLIMHNGMLADPANEWTRALKEISGKRKKTDADYLEMGRLEWMGGLYLHNGEPCIPGYVLEGALIGKGGAARKQKMGKQAAVGIYVTSDFPLEYEGPRSPKEMWELPEFQLRVPVVVGPSRVMRTRPFFKEWAAEIGFEVDTEFVNIDDATLWVSVAGRAVGLMDWRPKYGRFEVVTD